MNKLIYAIGITIAVTFIANIKIDKDTPDPTKKQDINQIEELPSINEPDSAHTFL